MATLEIKFQQWKATD